MDILTHTFSGIAAGTVISSFASDTKTKIKIVLMAGFAGALPDLDAISLWSQFDATLGSFFHLPASGKNIYSGKFWYSHHAFLHSLFAGVLVSILCGAFAYLFGKIRKSPASLRESFLQNRLLMIGCLFGFLMHLIEDMPTPASTWGGVRFFWPATSYIGGTGDLWWWNNYDIFLIVTAVILINLIAHLTRRFIAFDLRKVCIAVFVTGFSLSCYQIKTRPFDFAYSGYSKNYQQYELRSKEIQQEILSDRLYGIMVSFDNQLSIYF